MTHYHTPSQHMSRPALLALLTSRLQTTLLSATHSHGPRAAPVLRENMAACVLALRACFADEHAMDQDRVALEAAIAASRPPPADDEAAKALHLHVKARYRALKKKAFELA